MRPIELKIIPNHVVERGTEVCPLCDTAIQVYDIDGYYYAVPRDVTYSRIGGDSANGYELLHHRCLDKEVNT